MRKSPRMSSVSALRLWRIGSCDAGAHSKNAFTRPPFLSSLPEQGLSPSRNTKAANVRGRRRDFLSRREISISTHKRIFPSAGIRSTDTSRSRGDYPGLMQHDSHWLAASGAIWLVLVSKRIEQKILGLHWRGPSTCSPSTSNASHSCLREDE
jgi:hypothetical protein